MKTDLQMDALKKNITKISNFIFLLVILIGIIVSFRMNLVNRSLWRDEASLAESFLTRSLSHLYDGKFLNNQSAPMGWLFIMKITVLIFGHSEFVLRIWSFISYILTIVLIAFVSKRFFKMDLYLIGSAFYANLVFVLKYSNIFKPYIFDGVCVVFVVILFYLYENKKIKTIVFSLLLSIIIWFSNPVCFIEGGLLLSFFLSSIIKKEYDNTKKITATGVMVVISFVIYYFCWLREVATGEDMQTFWQGQNFPLFPKSKNEVLLAIGYIKELFSVFERNKIIVAAFVGIGFIVSFIKKNKMIIGVYIGFVICFFASSINMFPIEDRLWFFEIPIMICLCLYSISEIKHLNKYIPLIVLALSFIVVFSNRGIYIFMDKANIYWQGEEINPEIEYLSKNIKEDEKVYVYLSSVPAFKYKNGYDSHSIGGYEDNVIFGRKQFSDKDNYIEELEMLAQYEKFYICTSHCDEDKIKGLMERLESTGNLSVVSDYYDTYLWYFEKID